MNEILDLPPALDDNPNKKRTLIILFSITLLGIILRAAHLPAGALLRILGFGLLTGYTVHGLRLKYHPVKWFKLSLLICSLWLILAVYAWQTDPERSINGLGIMVYLGASALTYVICQSRHYIRKIRGNRKPDDAY